MALAAYNLRPLLLGMGNPVIQVTEKHLEKIAELSIMPGHKDSIDHQIVAWAIYDMMTLVSSDCKFALYEVEGLDFLCSIKEYNNNVLDS